MIQSLDEMTAFAEKARARGRRRTRSGVAYSVQRYGMGFRAGADHPDRPGRVYGASHATRAGAVRNLMSKLGGGRVGGQNRRPSRGRIRIRKFVAEKARAVGRAIPHYHGKNRHAHTIPVEMVGPYHAHTTPGFSKPMRRRPPRPKSGRIAGARSGGRYRLGRRRRRAMGPGRGPWAVGSRARPWSGG